MSDGTGIAWTDATWSPILGCSPASAGCARCYAVRDVWRMAHNPNPKIAGPRAGLVEKTPAGVLRWTGKVSLLPEQLEVPLRWKKPRRISVANQSDLFHEGVPDTFIAAVFGVMAASKQHTFQVLTKRPERARRWFEWVASTAGRRRAGDAGGDICSWTCAYLDKAGVDRGCGSAFDPDEWPLPNVWVGVSVEDQRTADERIPHLLATPATVRFLSCEPLIGRVDLLDVLLRRDLRRIGPGPFDFTVDPGIGWVIAGGESGSRPRPCAVEWVRWIVESCRAMSVPCFVKQLGAVWAREQDGLPDPKGADPEEWPEDLRVRQMPEVAGA
jgi:protein gp37